MGQQCVNIDSGKVMVGTVALYLFYICLSKTRKPISWKWTLINDSDLLIADMLMNK